jgi:hypothetical protein
MNTILTKTKTLAIGLLILAAQACYIDLDDDDGFGCIRARGPQVTETYSLPAFDGITNAIGADITLRQSSIQTVEITAAGNILDEIRLSVINGHLTIETYDCISSSNVDIFISIPDIVSVHNIGSGDIFGDNRWVTGDLDLAITGSGKIDAEFDASSLYADITGSGRLDLFGDVNFSSIRISGSGDVNAFGLDALQQDIVISGSGNCEVVANDLMDVVISGSGNVSIKGVPKFLPL